MLFIVLSFKENSELLQDIKEKRDEDLRLFLMIHHLRWKPMRFNVDVRNRLINFESIYVENDL